MSMEDELDEDYAPAWKPDEGDKLVGTVVDIGTFNGDYGAVPVITVKQDDGERLAFFAGSTVAKDKVAELAPQIGDRFGVVYKGLKTPKDGGREYHAYKIMVEHAVRALASAAAAPTTPWGDDEEPF